MRKLFLAALISMTVAASAFAKDTKNVNGVAIRNFEIEFSKASNVTWTSTDKFVKATFIQDNEKMEAFYNQSGEKIATSRTIKLDELPVKAKRTIAKDYAAYTIIEAIEVEGSEDYGFYVSAENEKESVILKVNGTGGLSIFKVTKK
jgi:hypothetical protein